MANLNHAGEKGCRFRTQLDFSHIRQRIRSEYGPATQSDAEVAGALSDVDKDIEDCNAEEDHLRYRIIFIQSQRRRLQEYKACLHFLRSSIRKLPNEIMLRIFDYACDMNELTSKKVKKMPTLAISCVSFRWRNLAMSIPTLWARIFIDLSTISSYRRKHLPVFFLFLNLSRKASLTIEITGACPSAMEDTVCRALIACSPRWKHLTVAHPQAYYTLTSYGIPQFSILEVLRLRSGAYFLTSHGLHAFQNATNLRELYLECIPLTMGTTVLFADAARMGFPWKQITRLECGGYPADIGNFFEMCGNLVELHFREVNSEGFVQQPLLLAKASALKTLTLSLCQTSRLSLAEMAFNSLTCPSLTSLLIEAQSEYVRPWPKATLQGFMERSSFHLTTLSIKCVSIGDSDLIDLLCRLPSLLHLTVDNCSFIGNDPLTPLLFRTLHACPPAGYHTASSTLVPNLISLDITFIAKDWEREEWKFIDQAFVEMVQSRWLPNESADGRRTLSGADVGIACLHSVVLRLIHREIDEEIYRPLKYLEKAGMRVIIIAKNP